MKLWLGFAFIIFTPLAFPPASFSQLLIHSACQEFLAHGFGVGQWMKIIEESPFNPAEELLADTAECFLETGASADDKREALQWAIIGGYLGVARLLIAYDVPVNERDTEGKSPLYWAVESGNNEIAKLLLDKGAYVNAAANDGRAPLHVAATYGSIQLVRLLISQSADIDVTDRQQETPLYKAVRNGHMALARLLLEHGADTNLQNKDGKRVIDVARATIKQELMAFLQSKVTNSQTVKSKLQPVQPTQPVTKPPGNGDTASQQELVFWQSIQASTKPQAFEAYLRQFPNGTFVALAQMKLEELVSPPRVAQVPASTTTIPALNYGQYHALVIGNNAYRNVTALKTPVDDARAISAVLRDLYGFTVTLLEDATRADILKTLTTYRKILKEDDNLLIYYAGHGWLDEDGGTGYWLPVDAEREDPTNWVGNASITTAVRGVHAKHVMVVADSCYAGALTRDIKVGARTPNHLARLVEKKARTVLTSGGLEPVLDSGGGNHSVFAKAFLDVLRENQGVIDGSAFFSKLRRPVMVNSDQTPEYGDIRKAGHDGGDFLFVRTK